MNNEPIRVGCTGERCDWTVGGSGGQPACVEGNSTCSNARLLTAAPSDFHDQTLSALTQQINALLQAVPSDPSGRKLSFLHSRQGTLLAWVNHEAGDIRVEGAITAKSDDAAIAQALGLRG
ncbi:MAG: hypothetical protein HYR56_02535 [Acidobacteria bacterium]|nr:hypothetical protein [Acidobacteriota bacterium]MBI3426447.1 hypothetical protein [Acidobacteriota bacterium]